MSPDFTWIILSLIAPMFWAVSNVIDQFLVRGSFDNSPWVYTIFQGAFYLPVILCLPFVFPVILQTPWQDAAFLMSLGVLWIPAVAFYVTALEGDDASVAVPIFNVVPFFVLIGGWMFLGEIISLKQILYGSLLVLSAAAITWDFHAKKLKWRTLMLMLASCVLYATYTLTARHQIETLHWAAVYFWYCLGFSAVSLIAMTTIKRNRSYLMRFIREKSKKVLYLTVLQSWLDVVAILFITAAIAKAPYVALVSFVASLQPLYVTIATGTAAMYHPKMFDRLGWNKVLAWKTGCVTVMLAALAGLIL